MKKGGRAYMAEELGVQDLWREVMLETGGHEIHNTTNMVVELVTRSAETGSWLQCRRC